jgi:hypothetical protein
MSRMTVMGRDESERNEEKRKLKYVLLSRRLVYRDFVLETQ